MGLCGSVEQISPNADGGFTAAQSITREDSAITKNRVDLIVKQKVCVLTTTLAGIFCGCGPRMLQNLPLVLPVPGMLTAFWSC